MKRIFLSIISIILIFAFTSCSVETADEYESRIESEAESIKDIQEMLTEEATAEETETTEEDVTTTTNTTTKETSTKEATTKSSTTEETTIQYITVYLTVECSVVIGNDDLETNAVIPENGVWLNRKSVVVPKGSSVYDVLVYARANSYLSFTERVSSGIDGPYITSINNLYEHECGLRKSGWTYFVNDHTYIGHGCSLEIVYNNDHVMWEYFVYP